MDEDRVYEEVIVTNNQLFPKISFVDPFQTFQ